MKRILTSSFFKCLCLEIIGHWLMAWCPFGATLFARGYLQPTWSHWTCLRLSEATQSIMKWGQRNWSKNVDSKRPFSTCFRLLTSPTLSQVILNPLSWLQLAGLYVIEAPGKGTATHAATRYSLTSWLTIPPGWHRLQHSWASRAHRRPSSYCGPTCWTQNPGSGQSYCSFNSHTNSNSALMKYILRPSGWTHSTKLYPDIKFCFHGILDQLADTINYFVCISVNEIYVETSCVSVLRCY